MTPEKEAELFVTLASIVTMLQQQGERIARMEGVLLNTPQTAENRLTSYPRSSVLA